MYNECVECGDAITNPICTECLSGRMRTWLQEMRPELAENIQGCNFGNGAHCLFCGEGTSVCAHCFSKDVYEYLNEQDTEVAEEFLSRFDFDLRVELM